MTPLPPPVERTGADLEECDCCARGCDCEDCEACRLSDVEVETGPPRQLPKTAPPRSGKSRPPAKPPASRKAAGAAAKPAKRGR